VTWKRPEDALVRIIKHQVPPISVQNECCLPHVAIAAASPGVPAGSASKDQPPKYVKTHVIRRNEIAECEGAGTFRISRGLGIRHGCLGAPRIRNARYPSRTARRSVGPFTPWRVEYPSPAARQ
jgi:hypothetical protein